MNFAAILVAALLSSVLASTEHAFTCGTTGAECEVYCKSGADAVAYIKNVTLTSAPNLTAQSFMTDEAVPHKTFVDDVCDKICKTGANPVVFKKAGAPIANPCT